MGHRLLRHPLVIAAGLLVVGALWLLLAPAQVGGAVSYIIVDGNSMEPAILRDDLAVVRRATRYDVGDIAVYRHPDIGPVIHRIIGAAGDRFIFKGDHNSFVDSYQPRRDELSGALWLHIPRAGKLLRWLRQPAIFTIFVVILAGSVIMPSLSETHSHARRMRVWPAPPARCADRIAVLRVALAGLAVVGILSLGLGIAAFRTPPAQTLTTEMEYGLSGTFAYSATAPAGIYPGRAAQPGDPIYRRLTTTLPISFTARLDTAIPGEIAGVGRLVVEVGDAAGWRQIIPLGEPITFQGNATTLAGTLDLIRVQEAIDTFERHTGVRNSQYSLTLAPSVIFTGTLGAAPFSHTFAPRLPFILDADRIRPLGEQPATMRMTESASLPRTSTAPATLRLWALTLDVTAARRIALIGGEIALIAGLAVAWLTRRMAAASGEEAAIQLAYGPMLIALDAPAPWMDQATPVASIDDLARLAEVLGQPILHLDAARCYYVRDADRAYRYRSLAPAALP